MAAPWFRRLVRLFPAEFQADYARDMERTFDAQRRHASQFGVRGVLRLWLETALDVVRTAPREHAAQVRQDASYALRLMARRPGFTAAAALVLAVGIAATTSIFSIVDAAVLRPLPFAEPDRLVAIREQTKQDAQPWELSYVSYVELRRGSRSFQHVAAYMRNGIVIGGPERVTRLAALISANLLDALRTRPLAGRAFTVAEDVPGGPAAALIRQDLAITRFGSVDEAIGRSLEIDGRATAVVGVLPASFRFPDADVDVWLPIGQLADEPWMRNRAVHVALVLARLRPEVSIENARAELDAWMAAVQAREPKADPDHRIVVTPFAGVVSAAARPAVAALAAAVLMLLVVTCSSVGLLLLTRAAGRAGEIAVRLSLGASRARLTRQLLTESACLAAVGAALGVAAAHLLLAYLRRGLEDSLPPFVVPRVDAAAVAVAAAAAGLAALVCGTAPAAFSLAFLRAPGAPRRHSSLIIAHVAVACVLVVLATLLGRSLDRLLRVDPGFRPERLLVMRVIAPTTPTVKQVRLTEFYRSVSARLERLPGVLATAVVSSPPMGSGSRGDLTIEGYPQRTAPVVTYQRVLPGYFKTLGIPLVAGRDFTERDGSGDPVIMVSAALARQFWPPGQAIGRRIKVGPAESESWKRIVGVVGDVRNRRLDAAPELATYEPHAQRPWNGMFVMVRTAGEPARWSESVRRALREVEPEVILSDVATVEERIAQSVASRRFHAIVVGGFAGATLVLVALALYGALAYSVSSRTREIGIRAAIGASSSRLMHHVLAEGLRPTCIGLLIGLIASACAASAARALLFEVTPRDIWTYVSTVVLLLAVGIGASWMPAQRATRIDPSVALRAD
jgi:predicted permease